LLLELLAFMLFFVIYKIFGLRFLQKKSFWQAGITVFILLVLWEWWAITQGNWRYGEEFMVGFIGIYPLEQFVLYGLTAFASITLWEMSKLRGFKQ